MRWLCLVGAVLIGGASSGTQEPDKRVVIVSWDGAKPSVIRTLADRGELPTVHSFLQAGTYTLNARTVLPSETLPAHTSMLTGLAPDRHGVNWNHYDPEKGYVTAATVFQIAKKSGLNTAMVIAHEKEKLKHLAKPGTLTAFHQVRGGAPKVARTALRVLRKHKPHLLFIHFADPDRAGHQFGWGNDEKGTPPSEPYLEALRRCDRALATIVAALKQDQHWQRALMILTADHGGRDRNHRAGADEDLLIPWIAAGGLAAPHANLPHTVNTMDTAATALAAFGLPVPENWDGKPLREILAPAAPT